MSVRIRLTRAGARHRPFYRIVVTDSRMPRDGRFIEVVGTYDPLAKAENVKVDGELVKDWMKKGAKPSEAVKHLLKRAGVVLKAPVVTKRVAKAVRLEELRTQAKAEGEQSEQPPSVEEKPKAAPPKGKASSKSAKPARKGTPRKKKAE